MCSGKVISMYPCISPFCYVTSCNLMEVYRLFRIFCRFHHQGKTIYYYEDNSNRLLCNETIQVMKAARTYEKLFHFYQTTKATSQETEIVLL
jgi:hypothetical protein